MGHKAHNKLTQEEVIESFVRVHKDNYSYDKVIYVGNLTDVEIYCNKHKKYFNQKPKEHKKGSGCYDCGRERQIESAKKGKDKFIEELIEIYGDVFDLSKLDYVNTGTYVELGCKTHGFFKKKPADLLVGQGCKKCKLEKSKYNNKKLFIQESTKLFGDITDYSKVDEISAMTKVNLRCTIHNHEFTISVSNRLGGQKCPKCAEENYSLIRKKTTEQFIKEAKEVYGDLHDYTDTVYTGCRRELEVICKKHNNIFKVFPSSYLDGFTCFRCRQEKGYKSKHHHTKEGYMYLANDRLTYLYLIKCFREDEEFYKIGKTFRGLNERFTKTNMPYNYEVVSMYSGNADKIWDLEEELHKKYKGFKYNPLQWFAGYTECYTTELPIEEIINLYNNQYV